MSGRWLRTRRCGSPHPPELLRAATGPVYSYWLTKVPYMQPSAEAAPDQSHQPPSSRFATGDVTYVAQEGFDGSQDEIRLDCPLGSLKIAATSSGKGVKANTNTYQFRPRVDRLQREELETRLATPFVANNGARGLQLSIEFKEASYCLAGDYVLHLWIERVR